MRVPLLQAPGGLPGASQVAAIAGSAPIKRSGADQATMAGAAAAAPTLRVGRRQPVVHNCHGILWAGAE